MASQSLGQQPGMDLDHRSRLDLKQDLQFIVHKNPGGGVFHLF